MPYYYTRDGEPLDVYRKRVCKRVSCVLAARLRVGFVPNRLRRVECQFCLFPGARCAGCGKLINGRRPKA